MKESKSQKKKIDLSEVDFAADEKIWEKYKDDIKAARREVFQKYYGKG